VHGYAEGDDDHPAFHLGDYTCPFFGDLGINYHDCTKISVGLPYDFELTALPLDLETANLSMRAKPKEIISQQCATNNTVAVEFGERVYWFGPDYAGEGLTLDRRDLEDYVLGTSLILETTVRSVANMPLHLLHVSATVGVQK
jgi:hypothetical protein